MSHFDATDLLPRPLATRLRAALRDGHTAADLIQNGLPDEPATPTTA